MRAKSLNPEHPSQADFLGLVIEPSVPMPVLAIPLSSHRTHEESVEDDEDPLASDLPFDPVPNADLPKKCDMSSGWQENVLWQAVQVCISSCQPGFVHRQIDEWFALCKQLPPTHREQATMYLIRHLDDVPLWLQPAVFALLRLYAVEHLEIYLEHSLFQATSSEHRQVLLEQAMLLDTHRTRKWLKHILEAHSLVAYPEQEEMVVHYLARIRAMEPVSFLSERLFSPRLGLGIRCQAVWMLGAFHSPQVISLLHSVLATKSRSEEQEAEWSAIRFLALFTLRRFAIDDVTPILQQGQRSSSLLHQLTARSLLGENLSV